MAKLDTLFKNNAFSIVSWAVTLVLVGGIVFGAFAWKRSTTVVQASAPVPTAAPDEEPADVQMPALGGPEAFVSIERDIQLKTSAPADKPRYKPVEYRVSSGNSIFAISKSYKLEPETILWANYDVLQDDPHSLKPGQVLNIPPTNGIFYQWKENDTLELVANEFKASVDGIWGFRATILT